MNEDQERPFWIAFVILAALLGFSMALGLGHDMGREACWEKAKMMIEGRR